MILTDFDDNILRIMENRCKRSLNLDLLMIVSSPSPSIKSRTLSLEEELKNFLAMLPVSVVPELVLSCVSIFINSGEWRAFSITLTLASSIFLPLYFGQFHIV